ncbi:type I restriction endonuclease subunit R [Bacteroidota bacterium]
MYSELKNIELPIIRILENLGWEYVPSSKMDTMRGSNYNHFADSVLKESIVRLNSSKGITGSDADAIINKLKRLDDNEEFHYWIKGKRTHKPSPDCKAVSINLIDLENPLNNSFTVTNQFTCAVTNPVNTNEKHIRPDIVLLVNGLPLTVIECKILSTEGSDYTEGIKQINRYIELSPALFKANVFNISTDGSMFKYGATGAPNRYFFEWKYDCGDLPVMADDEIFQQFLTDNPGLYNPYIDSQLFSLLNKHSYIDFITNFVIYETDQAVTIKKIARFQQYRAVNKIVDRVLSGEMKSGLIWHTQGSGKSLTMLFAAWKLRIQDKLKNPTVLIVVDRVDLDDQISGTFTAAKLPNTTRATSIKDLRKKLKLETREVIITTVFKFTDMEDILVERDNVILLIDEAHRTQEGENAAEMKRSLPNAFFFGFTGTPIDKRDLNTHRNFGIMPDGKIERYMDLYSIKMAIDDKATVPVHYQLRNRKWHLHTKDIDKIVDEEYQQLDDETLDTLKQKASSYYTFMMKPERLRSIAEDIVEHFNGHISPNGFKAQVVCYTRTACVLMKEYLDNMIGAEHSEVVFSAGLNDDAKLRKYHKTKEQVKKAIDNFKEADHSLKIILVQSMLLTGFDAPVEQVMYLDRPLKDHNLLQALARTNRPYDNKKCGMIIDYCGILKNLSTALHFDESEIDQCLIDFDKLKEELPLHIDYFKRLFTGVELSNLSQCLKHIEDKKLDAQIKKAYKDIQLTYEVLGSDPFILDYRDDYRWATQIILARTQQTQQKKPDVTDYLAHTRKIIQEKIDLTAINKAAPVFVIDDNYLRKLDGSELTKEERELTLEHRLRSVLRIKIGELPIYKTLQERLDEIIKKKNEESEDMEQYLRDLTTDLNEAMKQEKASGISKGERAVSQLLDKQIAGKETLKLATDEIHKLVLRHTSDFKQWQLQGSVRAKIKKDIFLYLAELANSTEDYEITSKDDFDCLINELMKYIDMHY